MATRSHVTVSNDYISRDSDNPYYWMSGGSGGETSFADGCVTSGDDNGRVGSKDSDDFIPDGGGVAVSDCCNIASDDSCSRI